MVSIHNKKKRKKKGKPQGRKRHKKTHVRLFLKQQLGKTDLRKVNDNPRMYVFWCSVTDTATSGYALVKAIPIILEQGQNLKIRLVQMISCSCYNESKN